MRAGAAWQIKDCVRLEAFRQGAIAAWNTACDLLCVWHVKRVLLTRLAAFYAQRECW